MILKRLFGTKDDDSALQSIYHQIVEQSRRPVFYEKLGVPDTIDGRFDLITLHMFVVLHRLKKDHEQTAGFAQRLFDTMFSDMDLSLREMGVSDLGVGPRIKKMGKAFYGRMAAYEEGVSGSDEVLESSLRRNLYGTTEPEVAKLGLMVEYLKNSVTHLDSQTSDGLMSGKVDFTEPD